MTVLYLLFKAYQPGLFDQQVQVSGHVTKRGTVVAPYQAKRKKRPEPPPGEDLFAQADRRAMEAEQKKSKEDAERKAREEAEKAEREAAERKAKEAEAAKKKADEDSDDPNSPNYRFRDTGYIAGSRKEEAASMIRRAGRAFQSYTEDKLASMGRRSDYLSALADNKHYMGDRPFPEGEERTRINEAFDRLIAAMRESKTLEKAARLWEARYLFLKAAA